ncbi:anti-sigma factor [Neorhizobium lilium]|uniref:Anti-sigma factor n=1 Tax=Neorhizobium lilium TaxID=2503024 RepID=A0A3S3RG40_9HYPH|nr:anti-sigma factor [Neorhizobium lilium]RWX76863.1 anti-sigma factor [Neorhizobium lilium]
MTTTSDDSEPDGPRDDLLAGEYVLGVLSLEDRRRVEARLRQEPALAAAVARWEDNLSALNAEYAEVTPPAETYARIESRLFGTSAGTSSSAVSLWNSLLLWRSLAFACSAALVAYLAYNGEWIGGSIPSTPLVAELSGQQEGSLTLMAHYDADSGRLQLAPVSVGPAQQHSLELWLVPGGDDPAISLGVLPQTGEGAVDVPPQLRPRLGEGVTFAVSLEPLGGSPNGARTGPIVAVGQARRP